MTEVYSSSKNYMNVFLLSVFTINNSSIYIFLYSAKASRHFEMSIYTFLAPLYIKGAICRVQKPFLLATPVAVK